MRLTDKLPEGIEYITGSMKLNGNLLTDAVDEDEDRMRITRLN